MDKNVIREKVWKMMEQKEIVSFPGAYGRIPNFVGAKEAAKRLAKTEEWKRAKCLKCNPDSPQRYVRLLALKDNKKVFMAVPRLRERRCFIELDPEKINDIEYVSTIKGAIKYGKMVLPEELPEIGLFIVGCVAVNRLGQKIGKGGGYSDLEYAIGKEVGCISPATRVATTVHPLQILDMQFDVQPYDLGIDIIATPFETIICKQNKKPDGILWDVVTPSMLDAIPVLKHLKR